MKTILQIIEDAGGLAAFTWARIENPPFMLLVIESLGEPGPNGHRALSIAHYGEQNGDLMRDPEMCFELTELPDSSLTLNAFYWRNDYAGIEEWSRYRQNDLPMTRSVTHAEHVAFAAQWSQNLIDQDFFEALESMFKELKTP